MERIVERIDSIAQQVMKLGENDVSIALIALTIEEQAMKLEEIMRK